MALSSEVLALRFTVLPSSPTRRVINCYGSDTSIATSCTPIDGRDNVYCNVHMHTQPDC